MKILVTLAVVALLAVAAVFYFGGEAVDLTRATPAPAETPTLDFTALGAVLQQDMSSIPASLDAPRVAPAKTFNVRSRLEGAPAPPPEYQTLGHVCELIIDADKEHSVRAGEARQTADAAARAQAQANWDAYRLQSDAEVHRLLASLKRARP